MAFIPLAKLMEVQRSNPRSYPMVPLSQCEAYIKSFLAPIADRCRAGKGAAPAPASASGAASAAAGAAGAGAAKAAVEDDLD